MRCTLLQDRVLITLNTQYSYVNVQRSWLAKFKSSKCIVLPRKEGPQDATELVLNHGYNRLRSLRGCAIAWNSAEQMLTCIGIAIQLVLEFK